MDFQSVIFYEKRMAPGRCRSLIHHDRCSRENPDGGQTACRNV